MSHDIDETTIREEWVDDRNLPYCLVTHAQIDAVRRFYTEGARLSTALSILLVLTERCNRWGGYAARKNGFAPSRPQLAKMAGVSKKTLDRYFAEFVEIGILVVERRWGASGSPLPNLYRLREAPAMSGGGSVTHDPGVGEPVTLGSGTSDATHVLLKNPSLKNPSLKKGSSFANAQLLPAVQAKPRARNEVFDALALACNYTPTMLSEDKDLAKAVGQSVAAIREKCPDMDDEAIALLVHDRAYAYRDRWPDIDLTPRALAKHWNHLTTTKPGGFLTPRQIAAMSYDHEAEVDQEDGA